MTIQVYELPLESDGSPSKELGVSPQLVYQAALEKQEHLAHRFGGCVLSLL